jgi:hypothetical protein
MWWMPFTSDIFLHLRGGSVPQMLAGGSEAAAGDN